jgi:hypothetical protein
VQQKQKDRVRFFFCEKWFALVAALVAALLLISQAYENKAFFACL